MMLIATAKSIVMAMVMVNGDKFQELAHGQPTLWSAARASACSSS